MLRIDRWLLVVVIGCSLLLHGYPVHGNALPDALERPDVRILIETSAGMHALDEAQLRGAFAEQLLQQLPIGSHAGVWSFARLTRNLAPHEPITELWRQMGTIFVNHLEAESQQVHLFDALKAVTWDRGEAERAPIEIILLSNGQLRKRSDLDTQQARQMLMDKWAKDVAKSRIRIHTIAVNPQPDTDLTLLQQLADLNGGLHRKLTGLSDARVAVRDILRMMQVQNEYRIDRAGRFLVAPGTQQFTVVWFADDPLQQSTALIGPNGEEYVRSSPLRGKGRWRVSRGYEMVSINNPQPGWWQTQGPKPQHIAHIGELNIQVQGLTSPVIPSDESSVVIKLFSNGQVVQNSAFLDLLKVRAWRVTDGEKVPLPVERNALVYEAFFVNLPDGAHDLQVDVQAPTFAHQVVTPFIAANPLTANLRGEANGAAAIWVTFNHSSVNYETLRVAAKLRKPPQIGSIVPAEKIPGGLWRIPVEIKEGIVEMSLTIAGNYLGGEGFFVKTKSLPINLPLEPSEEQFFRFDASGEHIVDPEPLHPTYDDPVGMQPDEPIAVASNLAEAGSVLEAAVEPPAVLIPWWFVLAISGLNLALAGFLWFLFKPQPLALPEPA